MSKIKISSIIVIMFIVFLIINKYISSYQIKLKNQNIQLQGQVNVLNEKISNLNVSIAAKDEMIKKDKDNLKVSYDENGKLKNKIAKLQSIKTIEPIKDDRDYVDKVYSYYNEKPIVLDNGFSLSKQTSFSIFGDAENWVVNGKTLEVSLDAYKQYCDSLEKTKISQAKTIDDLTSLNDDYIEKDKVKDEKDRVKDEIIKNTNAQLKNQEKIGILNMLKAIGATALVTYLTERAIEHRNH